MTMETVLRAFLDSTIAEILLKATAAMMIASGLGILARSRSAAMRHLIGAALFGFLLLLPIGVRLLPSAAIPVAVPDASIERATPTVVQQSELSVQRRDLTPTAASIDDRGLPWRSIALLAYLAGALGLGLSLVVGMWRLRRIRESGEVSVEGTRLALGLSMRRNLGRGPEVVFTSELAVPMTFGLRRPVILLPGEADAWSTEELTDAIRHELEHIRRFDWVTQIAARMVCAVYWPHPLVWFAHRSMSLEAERACDDAVLRERQNDPAAYADQLVALARKVSPAGRTPALAMARRSQLGRRVRAILDPRTPRGSASLRAALATLSIAVLSVLTLAPIRAEAKKNTSSVLPFSLELPDPLEDPMNVGIFEAAEMGNLRSVIKLLNEGADINAIVEGDGTPLIGAARAGQLDTVRYLLDHGADVNLAVEGDGNPLIVASKNGHLEIVTLLLERGADVSGQVQGDENALMNASWHGHPAIVRLLIERGADVNARIWVDYADQSPQGEWRTALKMARRGRSEAVEEGVRNGVAGALQQRYDDVIAVLQSAGARE